MPDPVALEPAMVFRLARRCLLVLLLASGGLTLSAGAASAADPSPTPAASPGSAVIHYSGAGIVTDDTGANNSYPVVWTVDCTGRPCTITGSLDDTNTNETIPLTGGILQPFEGGTGTYSYPESGNKCDGTWLGAYTITITATGNKITSSFDLPADGEADCGTTVYAYGAAHVAITTTADSGDVCFIFANCPIPSATAVAIGAPADGVAGNAPGVASPGTLSTLPTLASALSASNALWAAAMTTVLVILVAIPSHLFNTAVEHGSERVSAWWKRVRQRRKAEDAVVDAVAPSTRAVRFEGWPLAAGGVLAASLISSFVDPAFGLTLASPRVFLSILVSFLLDAVLGWIVVIFLVRRTTPTATARFTFVPATLLVVAAAVAFSRITGFQPGIVFGLVAGVVFGGSAAQADKARRTLVPLAWSFALALVGWAGYSALDAQGATDAVSVFARETLSAVAIGGIAALPIALIPLKGLAGYTVFGWNRAVWAASYALGLAAFFFVLMPVPFSWQDVPLNIWVWVAIYVLYAALAVTAWLVLARPWRREHEEGGPRKAQPETAAPDNGEPAAAAAVD